MPRAIVPGQFTDEKVMIDLRPLFKQYPSDKFEWLQGKAKALTPKSNSVTVELNAGGETVVSYDLIVIGTGSTATDGLPWKIIGDTENTKLALRKVQDQIKNAQTIVVAGGGLTGTETAAELGFEYSQNGTKEVYFIYPRRCP